MADEYIPRKDIEKCIRTEMASLDTEADKEFVIERLREEIPAADVVPVVRCKDCKHGTRLVCDLAGREYIECCHGNIAHRLDWFCADGERMDGEA